MEFASLWVGAGFISLGVLPRALSAGEARLTKSVVVTLAVIVSIAIVWAVVWTVYFVTSDRVARTFV